MVFSFFTFLCGSVSCFLPLKWWFLRSQFWPRLQRQHTRPSQQTCARFQRGYISGCGRLWQSLRVHHSVKLTYDINNRQKALCWLECALWCCKSLHFPLISAIFRPHTFSPLPGQLCWLCLVREQNRENDRALMWAHVVPQMYTQTIL